MSMGVVFLQPWLFSRYEVLHFLAMPAESGLKTEVLS
jgi:hypothetical protein